eukprot:TRINITY_DN44865_c0_g1_i1.p1 TRINITY_DN44865_c0_g1~~TRINITY_DN44865_c0_g1_i1.p1  ORF type:complete len:263 (-),score=48.49 TRINITY_DN44865_c0_g1_i1:23-811(-)
MANDIFSNDVDISFQSHLASSSRSCFSTMQEDLETTEKRRKMEHDGVVRPAPGPGETMTRELMRRDYWPATEGTFVLEFYGEGHEHGCFSNFFASPFEFVVPEEICSFSLSESERTVACNFSEKAIMLCKAASMSDREGFFRIAKSKAQPSAIKKMGRDSRVIKRFDQRLWERIECSVAFEVVFQKFSKLPELRTQLLATQDWLIAEATSNDKNWGTGLDKGDKRNQTPKQWQGTNMLGWALMQARAALREEFAGRSEQTSR